MDLDDHSSVSTDFQDLRKVSSRFLALSSLSATSRRFRSGAGGIGCFGGAVCSATSQKKTGEAESRSRVDTWTWANSVIKTASARACNI